MIYCAHTADGPDSKPAGVEQWQLLKDHLRSVAELAGKFAFPLGMEAEAKLAGLLHDLGKYRDEFQTYLHGERASSVETQHAIYGAAWAFDRDLAMASFAVAGHHAGLHDLSDLQQAVVQPRLDIPKSLEVILPRFEADLGALPAPPPAPSFVMDGYAAELATRLLFSCLVDADRLDTASWPDHPIASPGLQAAAMVEQLRAERDRLAKGRENDPLVQLRSEIFDACLSRAALAPGFFSLTVPTGGGKTLAAMAFALEHARTHGLRRIIVVIPYLSIIEQNAAVYRRVFGDDVLIEAHSAVEPPSDADETERSWLELVSENWDAPVIVTTSVQFIESLFAASPSRCRKLHRIARSVVIFDEVQALPTHLLQPSFSVFRELARNYGTSFVFSSATQPAFRRCTALPDGFSPEEAREIAPEPERVFRSLRRVAYNLPPAGETLDWPALAARLAATPQVLCVVNLTRHARELWQELRRSDGGTGAADVLHLSAGMCPAHRLAVLAEIKSRLVADQPCRVVATQLIEAGVDVDFPVVWRAMGPLDSIVQVAGRCNREGRREAGEMHVFHPADARLPGKLYEAATSQAAITLDLLARRGDPAEALATEPGIFADYFQCLWQTVNTDYAKPREGSIQEERAKLRFRQVARKARVIDDDGQPVIVATDNIGKPFAEPIIDELRSRERAPGQRRFARDDLRHLQRFMVNVRGHNLAALQRHRQALHELLPNLELFVLDPAYYHPQLGLLIDGAPPDDFLL